MKYNVFTIFNSKYIKFARIFFNSFYKTQDLSKVNLIYVYNPNIKDEDKEWLKKFDKIKLLDNNYNKLKIKNESEWTSTIMQKTYILKQLLENENCYPLVMIDIDCMFLKDISDLIDIKFDLQICKRDFKPKPLIASFVCFNNKKVLKFIDLWINKISGMDGKIKETPALCRVYNSEKNNYKIDLIEYRLVSATDDSFINDDTRILHFKGSCTKQNGVETRLKRINNFEKVKDIKKIVTKYLEITKC